MSARNDALVDEITLDRVFYATGTLLSAEDFRAEQNYHRGRLARALAYLHGSGTIAGLRVEYDLETIPGSPPGAPDQHVEKLVVHSGLAIDRLGRLIEVPRTTCLRIDRWYQDRAQSSDQVVSDALKQAFKANDVVVPLLEAWYSAEHGDAAEALAALPADVGAVVADLFLGFVSCERGKTPALAAGPFDALDAVQPSRLRDEYRLELVLRPEADLTAALPTPTPWPDLWRDFSDAAQFPDAQARAGALDARRRELKNAVLAAWPDADDGSPDPPEYALSQPDKTTVFLGRIFLLATRQGDQVPQRLTPTTDTPASAVIKVANHSRLFVYIPRALARAEGI